MREVQKTSRSAIKTRKPRAWPAEMRMEVTCTSTNWWTTSGLPDRAKLAIQMDHFDRMMDLAKREKPAGLCSSTAWAGVLGKPHVLEQHHPDCSYREGDPRRYGSGATEVWLGQASWRKQSERHSSGPLSFRRLLVGRAVRGDC